ncbi:MAG: alpha-galactosidase [Anaerolineae bacterium]|jgi:alpha-galactosidase
MSQHKPVLAFDPNSGANLSWPQGPRLEAAVGVVRYRLRDVVHTLRLAEPDRPVSAHGLRAVWRWLPKDRGCRVWVEVANDGEAPLHLETADVLTTPILDLGAEPERWTVYQNGLQSWTPTFARHLDDSLYTDPGTPDYRAIHRPHWGPKSDQRISSEWVTVLAPRSSPRRLSLLAGFVGTKGQLSEVLVRTDGGELIARCHFDGALLAPGGSVRSETLMLRAESDPLALLETWAEVTGEEMEARTAKHPPTGWCTWYYFYGENTAVDIQENLEAIARHDLPLDVILIDDGYQTAIGDWLSLDAGKFPEGMESVARAIRRAGHRPGIWTAPFGAGVNSQLLAEHRDWLLHDEAGKPVVGWTHWGVDCHALDCTHPEVLTWLEETFARMRTEWGVAFFKIDFIFAAARPGRRHDPTATGAQALRRGVEAIRAGVGDDAFLLGCGAPLGPCVGLVDGMRVGPDVDPNWDPIWRHDLSMPSTKNALRNAVARAPFHGRLWVNDPDCLLVRQRGEDMDLVLNEMRTLSALVALLGGSTINADHLSAIRPGRLKYLRQTLPPTGVSARPLDLFENELPRLLLLPVEREWGRWWVAGVVNWDDHTTETTVRLAELGLPPGRYHVYHYWRRRYLGATSDSVTVHRHQPHETAVLLFKPVSERPDLLTTTFHVCQGMVEVGEYGLEMTDLGAQITVRLQKAGRQFGRVLFTVPKGWRISNAQVDDRQQALVTEAPGVISLGLTLEGKAEVQARFERVHPLTPHPTS